MAEKAPLPIMIVGYVLGAILLIICGILVSKYVKAKRWANTEQPGELLNNQHD